MQSSQTLFEHKPHPHKPKNVNQLHKNEYSTAGFNMRVAVAITRGVSSMFTAYSFALLAIIGLLAIFGILPPLVAVLVVWLSQTFLQLCFLPILSVGQSVLSRHSEIMAEEQFHTTERSYHHLEEIIEHLNLQDAELLKQTTMLVQLLEVWGGGKATD
jgi:hypothetical protein